jgi:hypothetical protein
MKSFLFLSLSVAALATAVADDVLPQQEKFSRYEPMLKHSPFAVATAGAPVSSTPDFAKDLYVANAARTDSGDFVTIASTTDRNFKEYLSTKESIDGYAVPNIQWSDRVGETKVTITKDGQVATLSFNEAVLSQAIQNPVPQVIPAQRNFNGRPAVNNLPVIPPRPMQIPTIPTPPPHTRPLIPRNIQNRQRPIPPRPDPDEPDE